MLGAPAPPTDQTHAGRVGGKFWDGDPETSSDRAEFVCVIPDWWNICLVQQIGAPAAAAAAAAADTQMLSLT